MNARYFLYIQQTPSTNRFNFPLFFIKLYLFIFCISGTNDEVTADDDEAVITIIPSISAASGSGRGNGAVVKMEGIIEKEIPAAVIGESSTEDFQVKVEEIFN